MTQATHPTPGKPLSDGWIEWTGGDRPEIVAELQVRMRDGFECIAHEGTRWAHYDRPLAADIIAYRIARPTPVGGDQEAQPSPAEPVAIVPPHCTGISLSFDPGVLHVSKDGSGYIAISEEHFSLEDDRCEGPDGPEGSVHWITRMDASEIVALRDFLNGSAQPSPAASGWPSRDVTSEEMFGVSGAADEAEALAVALFCHRCPGVRMTDEDLHYYRAAAVRALLAVKEELDFPDPSGTPTQGDNHDQ